MLNIVYESRSGRVEDSRVKGLVSPLFRTQCFGHRSHSNGKVDEPKYKHDLMQFMNEHERSRN